MKLAKLNENRWYCFPVIGGVLALLFGSKVVLKKANEEGEKGVTVYKETYREEGSGFLKERTKVVNNGSLFILFFGFVVLYAVYETTLRFVEDLLVSPYIIFSFVYFMGLATYLYKERINSYLNSQIKKRYYFPLNMVIAVALSWLIPGYYINGGNGVVWLGMSVILFLGVFGPFMAGLTLMLGFYSATFHQKRWLGLLFTRMNLVLLASIYGSIALFAKLTGMDVISGSPALLASFQSTLREDSVKLLYDTRDIKALNAYLSVIGMFTVTMLLPIFLNIIVRFLAVKQQANDAKSSPLSLLVNVLSIGGPIALIAIFTVFPNTLESLAQKLDLTGLFYEMFALHSIAFGDPLTYGTPPSMFYELGGVFLLGILYPLPSTSDYRELDKTKKTRLSLICIVSMTLWLSFSAYLTWWTDQQARAQFDKNKKEYIESIYSK